MCCIHVLSNLLGFCRGHLIWMPLRVHRDPHKISLIVKTQGPLKVQWLWKAQRRQVTQQNQGRDKYDIFYCKNIKKWQLCILNVRWISLKYLWLANIFFADKSLLGCWKSNKLRLGHRTIPKPVEKEKIHKKRQVNSNSFYRLLCYQYKLHYFWWRCFSGSC